MKKFASGVVAALILIGLVGCAASEKNDQSGATQSAQNQTSIMTAAEAQAIALNHAGFTAEQVTFLHTGYQVDDGVPEYEVEFRQAEQEYDYTIHAETGEILEFDQELDQKFDKVDPTIKAPAGTGSTPNDPAVKLTREQAQAIALEHAGAKADQVTQLRVEYDLDDGVPEYDVEFRWKDLKYDYTIHAETGKILSSEQESNPVYSPTAPEETPSATEPVKKKLTREEARDIALKHAGVELSDIKNLKIEYEVDDGVPEYSVEFRVGKFEINYEIHAETGHILKSEKDVD